MEDEDVSEQSRIGLTNLGDGADGLDEVAEEIRDWSGTFRNALQSASKDAARFGYDTLSEGLDSENRLFDPEEGTTVVEPREDRDGCWAGALTAFRDEAEGETYLCYRFRNPDERGREAVVARMGETAAEAEEVWSVDRDDLGAQSIEGGTLYERDGSYRLYLSYQDAETDRWKLAAVPGDSVESLDANRAEDVELPTGKYEHVKDPFVHEDTLYVHAATSNFSSLANFEVDLADSGHDEVRRIEIADPDSSDSRLTSIFSTERAEIALYDWKRSIVFTGEEKNRPGTLSDGTVTPLLSGSETFLSPHGSGSLRYVRALSVGDEVWFFYEMSMPEEGHETRVYEASEAEVENAVNGLLDE